MDRRAAIAPATDFLEHLVLQHCISTSSLCAPCKQALSEACVQVKKAFEDSDNAGWMTNVCYDRRLGNDGQEHLLIQESPVEPVEVIEATMVRKCRSDAQWLPHMQSAWLEKLEELEQSCVQGFGLCPQSVKLWHICQGHFEVTQLREGRDMADFLMQHFARLMCLVNVDCECVDRARDLALGHAGDGDEGLHGHNLQARAMPVAMSYIAEEVKDVLYSVPSAIPWDTDYVLFMMHYSCREVQAKLEELIEATDAAIILVMAGAGAEV